MLALEEQPVAATAGEPRIDAEPALPNMGGCAVSGRGRRSFWRSQDGAVAIYVVFLATVLFGVLALVFDVGRLAVVRSQTQNAADAAALAAAVHLDGQAGARARAETVARGAAANKSGIETTTGSADIRIDAITFYRDENKTPATSDRDAALIEVTVVPRPVKLVLQPIHAALAGTTAQDSMEVGATAMAVNAPIICDPPALLICNPDEMGLDDITKAAAAGRQVLLRQTGNVPAPGDFGLMCPPPYENCGASIIEDFLASEGIDECTATAFYTKTGVNFSKVNNGINHRFEDGSLGYPTAPNIIDYPRDDTFDLDTLGSGDWDRDAYWEAAHDGELLPADLMGATRYQVYLYELGASFARGNSDGRTLYPVPDSVPGNFSVVAPPPAAVPADGVPPSNPNTDPLRRVMPAAVVQCQALDIAGHSGIESRDIRIVDIFISEAVGAGAATDSPIVGEIVGPRTSTNSNSNISNVRLVE